MITYKIGDLFDLEAGYAFKSKDFTDTGIPVLKIKNVKANSIPLHNLSYVEKNFLKTKKDKLARKGDILITMSGNRYDGTKQTWVGKVAEFKHEGLYFINQRVGALRPKPTAEIDISCCSYFLSSGGFQNRFIAIATSSGGQANLSPDQILNEKIALPSIRNQKAIGDILNALDDKIENNRQMNETLEEIAFSIFKSWFVDFDPVQAKVAGNTPAHMDAKTAALFPSSFGDDGLPKSWREEPLYNIATFINGAAYKNMHFCDPKDGLPVIKIAELKYGISSQTKFTNTDLGEKYKISTGEIFFAWSGSPQTSINTFIWPYGNGWLNQHIFAVKENGFASLAYIYFQLKVLNPKFIEIATDKQTTGLGHVTVKDMKEMLIISPPDEVRECFEQIANSLFEKIKLNLSNSQTLTELRDTLLPKLMSGEIRLKDAEREVEAAI